MKTQFGWTGSAKQSFSTWYTVRAIFPILACVVVNGPLAVPLLPVDTERHTAALSALYNQRSALDAEWEILRHQEEVLMDYSMTFKSNDTSPDQLVAFLSAYEEKQSKLDERLAVLKEKMYRVDDEIITLNADEESLKRAVKITVIILADEDGPAELSLTYMVSNAWWTPLYDLRATIAHDAKSSTTFQLHYRASVSQSTGEDWSSVALTLSTASPLQGDAIPTLQPEWVSKKYKRPSSVGKRGRNGVGAVTPPEWSESLDASRYRRSPSPHERVVFPSRYRRSSSPHEHRGVFRGRYRRSLWGANAPPSPPPRMRMPSTAVNVLPPGPPPGFFVTQNHAPSETAVSATFTIAGLSSIPSNTSKSSQTHKVSIAEVELSAIELEWVTIPKEVPSVFLQVRDNVSVLLIDHTESRISLIVQSPEHQPVCVTWRTNEYLHRQ
jgi:hypothetical protein